VSIFLSALLFFLIPGYNPFMSHIQIIYDRRSFRTELFFGWGFSCLIDGNTLFDTGEKGDRLLANLSVLGIDLDDIDQVVLSHDHWDHWGGLQDLLARRPGLPVWVPRGISSLLHQEILRWGGLPRTGEAGAEVGSTCRLSGTRECSYKGEVMNEQALVIRGEKGVSVITGCAHPGVEVMARAAGELYPGDPLYTIMGGFHLHQKPEDEVVNTVNNLRVLGFTRILATHCAGLKAEALSDDVLSAGWESLF